MKNIVIIGGMGPQASLELHKQIINRAANMGAKDAEDFPMITHLSLPFADFISDESKKHTALEIINENLRCLYLWQKYQSSYCL